LIHQTNDMNIKPETIELLKKMYSICFFDKNANDVPADKADELRIGFERETEFYIGKSIKATKKEITLDYVLSKINADKVYQNFTDHFNKVVKDHGLRGYPTTYGIGVFVAVGLKKTIQETKDTIQTVLDQMGVKYSNEYSEAGWVFRYKISKSKENIEIISKLN
jgi:hypothetical protein